MIKIKAGNARKTQSNRCSQSIRFAHGLGPAHGASFSTAIAKFPNAEIDHFRLKLIVHVLIRGSLCYKASAINQAEFVCPYPQLSH